ncbi:DUF424 family protein [archaeon]|nr:DUF424 family protein [archaeon]
MYVKIHQSKDRHVVAICDEDLIGKTFSQGKLILEITERFYKGDKLSDEETYELMKNAINLNIVGKKAIKLALKHRLITKENIIKIKSIPHAQVYQIE